MKLSDINPLFRILAKEPNADEAEIFQMQARFGVVKEEYRELIREATDVELQHKDGYYFRIWGPLTCIDMDEGYKIGEWIPGAVPIGDNGGGKVVFYFNGLRGSGLYIVGFGDLVADDAVWICSSLDELLGACSGVETLE